MITSRHQASPVALELIKRFEGVRHGAVRLADGRWAIGHGHTLTAREGAVVSDADAEALLVYDLRTISAAIDAAVFTPLSQNQFDALAAFVFNVGMDSFRHSAVLRRINEGQLIQAAFALEIWRMADFDGERIVVDALVRRRAAEKALFLTPDGGWIPAPSTLIEPKADYGLVVAAPEAEATETLAGRSGAASTPIPGEPEGPSPVEQAAANLAARLETLAPDPPVAAALGEMRELSSEPAPFPDDADASFDPAPPETPAAPPASGPLDVEAMRRTLYGAPDPRPPLRAQDYAPLALLGAAGLTVFIGALVWAFHARPASVAPGPVNFGVVALGFIGILAVAGAVYLLLEKLAGREP